MHTWDTWKLRALLFTGLFILLLDALDRYLLGIVIPPGLNAYLTLASGYFALDPQRRIAKYREQVLLIMLFPGAFVTALLPVYTLMSFAIRKGW